MKRLALLILFAAFGCQGEPRDPYKVYDSNLWADEPKVELTEAERCEVELLNDLQRKKDGDRCLIDCIERGAGRNVGGGCWHACARFPMSSEPNFETCYPSQ